MIEEVLSAKCQVLGRASRTGSLPRPLTSVLALQTCGGTPAAGGLSCETKPIPATRHTHHPTIPARRPSCQTNPIRGSSTGVREAIMRNKAKLGRAGTYGQRPSPCTRRQSRPAGAIEPNRAKQTQFAPAQNDRWGIPHSARECDCAKQTQFGPGQWLRRDRMCETKPKDRSRQSVAGSRLYKQTQFAGANRATSPRCPASGNKPNSRMRQNKTNFGSGKRAKQTQFGSPWRSGPETERPKQSQLGEV
jgi:hypothetical protein